MINTRLIVCFGALLWPAAFRYTLAGQCENWEAKWYKGSLHAHSNLSDGTSSPAGLAAWYKQNGYRFAVISDHDRLTDVSELNVSLGVEEAFLLIPGEEISSQLGDLPVHLSGYSIREAVVRARGGSVSEVVERNANAIRAAGGVAAVNHPNFGWAITSSDLVGVSGYGLLEIYNGHPLVNNRGGGGYESAEDIWDVLLTAGKRVFGIAVDDTHVLTPTAKNYANPGRGWVVVRACSLSAENMVSGLEKGDFYASTGVEIEQLVVTESDYVVAIKSVKPYRYRTVFIGESGRVLGVSNDEVAVYRFTGGEKYVRARVEASNGDVAWTQPVFP